MNELAETMESVFEELVGMPPPQTKGDGTVIWYLKALQRCDWKMESLNQAHDAARKQLAEWHNLQHDTIRRQVKWLDETYLPTVEAVTRAKIAHSGKKSFEWPFGTCSFRQQQDEYEWPEDDSELIEWLETNRLRSLVRIVKQVERAKLKKYIKETGEVPPMVTVTPRDDLFYVKPAPLALPGEQSKLLGV